MRAFLVVLLLVSFQYAGASEKELSAEEALQLFHISVHDVKNDVKDWLLVSKRAVSELKSKSANTKECKATGAKEICEKAILEYVNYSRFELADNSIFELEHDLKTKYKFDIKDGMRLYQMSSSLRWFVKKDELNGVPLPKDASYEKGLKPFIAAIEQFHMDKSVEVAKGEKSLPPLPRR